MEKALREYTRWRSQKLPEDLMAELAEIQNSEKEIYDRFCKDISFGTSGMRGKMGAGTNRINSVTLRRASIGIARILCEKYAEPTLVIAYDTRINSKEYAAGVAEVFASQGVCVYLFDEPTPVPLLSFAVRDMSLCGGIMITASHNTKEYNGYKVYDRFGNQIDDKNAVLAEKYIKTIEHFAKPKESEGCEENTENAKITGTAVGKCGEILTVPKAIKEHYMQALESNTAKPQFDDESLKQAFEKALTELRICYTPLNGAGRNFVIETLKRLGMCRENIIEVESQKEPNGNFETCPYPNPEQDAVFEEALRVCEAQEDKPRLILATDPDSDRLGVMCLSGSGESSEYVKLSGNQLGELLLDYVCACECGKAEGGGYQKDEGDRRDPKKAKIAFKSHVSSPLAEDIATAYGVQMRNVFTGFKNIAAGMQKIEESGEAEFIFGFEESLGYLCGDYTRDKDGVMAARLVCLLAAQLANEGKTLCDRLDEIYEIYGYMEAMPFSVEYGGERERKKIDGIMTALFDGKLKQRSSNTAKAGNTGKRTKCIECLKDNVNRIQGKVDDQLQPFEDAEVVSVRKEICYRTQNMYSAELEGGHRLIVRPSGTEPKLKVYIFACGTDSNEAEKNAETIRVWVKRFLDEFSEM